MMDLYYWPTPNGHKITMFLEEARLQYPIIPVDISAGDQFKPAFLAISPNNRMPAIVDDACRQWRAGFGVRVRGYPALSGGVMPWQRQEQNLDDFRNLRRRFDAIRARPGTVRACEKAAPYSSRPAVTDFGKKLLFGQTAASVARAS